MPDNPEVQKTGTIMGYNGAELKDIPATYLVLDTGTLEARVFGL